jgi:hypothetical protein
MPIWSLVYLPSLVKFRLELSTLSLGWTDVHTHAHTDGWRWMLYPPWPLHGWWIMKLKIYSLTSYDVMQYHKTDYDIIRCSSIS